MTTKPRVDPDDSTGGSIERTRDEWVRAEDEYRTAIDRMLARPAAVPTKDDLVVLAQARARADHKQARYFRDSLR